MDGGANGGIAGSDMCVHLKMGKCIDLSGADEHMVGNLELVTTMAALQLQWEEFVGIFH